MISKAAPWPVTVRTADSLPGLLTLKTFPPGESVLALGFLHTPFSPSCRARLRRELRDVGQVGLLRGKGRAVAPRCGQLGSRGRVTHKGRVNYQGDSFELIAEVGKPSAHEG